MRVLITKVLTGSVDGMELSRLLKGRVYDVYTSLACYLLSEEVAESAFNDEPERTLTSPRSVANDRSRKRTPKKA